jgi:hypothetical protein
MANGGKSLCVGSSGSGPGGGGGNWLFTCRHYNHNHGHNESEFCKFEFHKTIYFISKFVCEDIDIFLSKQEKKRVKMYNI